MNNRPRIRGARPKNRMAAAPMKEIVVEKDELGRPVVEDWDTYRILAGQTEAKPKLWSPETVDNLRMVHHLIGLCTEVDELIPTADFLGLVADNAHEEVGDLLWYLANIHNIHRGQGGDMIGIGEALEAIWHEAAPVYEQRLVTLVTVATTKTRILDAAKRLLAYGDGSMTCDVSRSFLAEGLTLVQDCIRIAIHHGGMKWNLVELMQANVDKLSKRYTEGFDAQEAVNRQLEVEAQALRKRSGKRKDFHTSPPAMKTAEAVSASSPVLDIEGAEARQANPELRGRAGRTCRNR